MAAISFNNRSAVHWGDIELDRVHAGPTLLWQPLSDGSSWASSVGVRLQGEAYVSPNQITELNHYSPNGDTWIASTFIGQAATAQFSPVAYGNGIYLAIGRDSLGNHKPYTSADGRVWTVRDPVGLPVGGFGNSSAIPSSKGLVFIGGRFLYLYALTLTATTTTSYYFVESTDGINWSAETISPTAASTALKAAGSRIEVANGNAYAVGSTRTVYRSTDGLNWSAVAGTTLPTAAFNIAHGNGTYVILGASGTQCWTSSDGAVFTPRSIPVAGNWTALTFDNGRFMALATGSRNSMTSVDGINWTPNTLPVTGNWSQVLGYKGRFYAFRNISPYILVTQ